MIKFVTAGDENFKMFVDNAVKSVEDQGYEIIVYDLGGLGYGHEYYGKFGNENNAKLPCKPRIILDCLKNHVSEGEYLVWFDADALLLDNIDEIEQDYDIGVTVRQAKTIEHQFPINAGIVFFKKNSVTMDFVKTWISLADKTISDQPPLNQLCAVTTKNLGSTISRGIWKIKVFPCVIYNNVYFKRKPQPLAKIKHYKSKLRRLYPFTEK